MILKKIRWCMSYIYKNHIFHSKSFKVLLLLALLRHHNNQSQKRGDVRKRSEPWKELIAECALLKGCVSGRELCLYQRLLHEFLNLGKSWKIHLLDLYRLHGVIDCDSY